MQSSVDEVMRIRVVLRDKILKELIRVILLGQLIKETIILIHRMVLK
jgi:hypothetical protein